MHLDAQNIHARVFGGLLMHEAHDLAYAAVAVFFGDAPTLSAIDHVSFRHPVKIGSLLHLEATVVYKHGQSAVVRVVAKVIDPATGQRNITNTFFLTFRTHRPRSRVPDLMPATYAEALWLLEGKRKFEQTNRKGTPTTGH